MGQKLRMLQMADFEQIWYFFSVFIIFDRFINSFFGKFYAQIAPSNLLNIMMYFDFEIDQPFPNYQGQKVKFLKFT